LRRDVLADFQETIREVTPLYEELRQETAIARGAANALRLVRQRGLRKLKLAENMGLCNWQQRGIFSDSAVEAYLVGLRGYDPVRPPPLAVSTSTASTAHIDLKDFSEAVHKVLPIRDALEWLIETYPGTSLQNILRLYGRLHSGEYGSTSFGDKVRDYSVEDLILSACPMTVGAHVEDDSAEVAMRGVEQ
jgi:hypothetical protein